MNFSLPLLLLAALLDPDRRKLIEIYESQMDALRSQIPRKLRLTQPQKARMALAAKVLGRKALKEITTLVTPDTLFHWYREAVRAKWDYSNRRDPGRPKPKTHWETLVGTDFFTWEIFTPFGLATYYVLFFIRQKTREVHLAGVTTNPTMRWMMQVAKNLTMTDLGWLRKGQIASLLVHDRAGQFCPAFKRILRNEDIQTLALPFQSPNLNAYAERWVRSIKE